MNKTWKQNLMLTDGQYEEQKVYWKKKLMNKNIVTRLAYDNYCKKEDEKKELSFIIEEQIFHNNNSMHSDFFVRLIAAVSMSLMKLGKEKEIVIGSPVLKEQNTDRLNEWLLYRIVPEYEDTVEEFRVQVEKEINQSIMNGRFPVERMVKNVTERETAKNSCPMGVMVVLEEFNHNILTLELDCDILIQCKIHGSTGLGVIRFDNKYKRETISQLSKLICSSFDLLAHAHNTILKEIIAPKQNLDENILTWMRGMRREYPYKTICEAWKASVKDNFSRTAIIGSHTNLTYSKLEEESNRAANKLREGGVKPNTVVAIILEKPVEGIIVQLAVLKLGSICLPIQKNYPTARLSYMLTNSDAKCVVCDMAEDIGSEYCGSLIEYADIKAFSDTEEIYQDRIEEKDTAYLIYTSGTTGKPKGVMLNHKGILNHLYTKLRILGLKKDDILSRNFSVNSVAAIWQTFAPLLSGGTVAVHNSELVVDTYGLLAEARNLSVTAISMVPSQLGIYMGQLEAGREQLELPCMKAIILTGEKTERNLVKQFYNRYQITLWNAYGQSECSDDTLHYQIPYDWDGNTVPIGTPSDNTEIYILDHNLEIVPLATSGEICVTGDGVANGYLGMADSDKFIANPYCSSECMYRTGDIGYWNEAGSVEYVGRIDRQVEIRGFRIELAEVEKCILELQGVYGAAAVVKGKNKDYLYAYLLAREELKEEQMREALKEKLPEQMIPARMIQLDAFPLTPTGKIDMKELERRKEEIQTEGVSAPRDEIDYQLCHIWNELLDRENIGIDDDFFVLGGNSLKAASILYKVEERYHTELDIRQLFRNPTIRWISDQISGCQGKNCDVVLSEQNKESYPLTQNQLRLYVLSFLVKDATPYNINSAFILEQAVDIDVITDIWKELIERHEALRTYFQYVDEHPVQIIQQKVDFRIAVKNLPSSINEDKIEEEIQSFIKPFRLDQAPLLRVGIFVLNGNKSIMVVDMHHIIADGVSLTILFEEFMKRYKETPLKSLQFQYRDYLLWQNETNITKKNEAHKNYWMNRFKEEVPDLEQLLDKKRPRQQSFRGDTHRLLLSHDRLTKIRTAAREEGTTLFTLLYAAVNILLHKYTGNKELVIGTPVIGREKEEMKSIVGMFVNTIALKATIHSKTTIAEFLQESMIRIAEGFYHQNYPFEELVTQLDMQKDRSKNPLFQVMLLLHEEKFMDSTGKRLGISPYPIRKKSAQFDLTFEFTESEGGLYIDINYSTDIFSKKTVISMASRLSQLIQDILPSGQRSIKELSIISEAEKDWLLEKGRGRESVGTDGRSLIVKIVEQVNKTPDRIAIEDKNRRINYKQLWQEVSKLEGLLLEKRVEHSQIVVVQIPSSIEFIQAVLALIAINTVCLPIDMNCGEAHKNYILNDSQADWIITYEDNKYTLNKVIRQKSIETYHTKKPLGDGKGAFLIYTSGTTNIPKGVVLSQKGILNHINTKIECLEIGCNDSISHNFNVSFVASIWQFLTPLILGGRVVIPNIKMASDSYSLLKEIYTKRISLMSLVPAQLNSYLNQLERGSLPLDLDHLRYLILTGDKVESNLVQRFHKWYKIPLVNAYGLSECTDDILHYKIPYHWEGTIVPIGRPANNTKIYILDENHNLLPPGIKGEIFVGGDCLASYLNGSEERFVDDLFEPDKKLYRTGDIGRWNEHGEIECFGRIDQQIKLRGFRIELTSIENCLEERAEIEQAVAVQKGAKDGEYICCYILANQPVIESDIKEWLRNKMPEYMIPTRIITLRAMPFTSTGKIDKRALEERKEEVLATLSQPPRNALEKELCELWKSFLSIEELGIDDDFFALGGNSLKCTEMTYKLNQKYKADLEVDELFLHPSIRWLSERLKQKSANEPVAVVQEVKAEPLQCPLSLSQKRIFILSWLEKGQNNTKEYGATPYNINSAFKFYEKMDIDKFERACQVLIERHEAFRTSFHMRQNEPVQIVHNKVDFKIDLLENAGNTEYEIQKKLQAFIRPFDISIAPLLRVGLLKLGEEEYILIFDMHHIIADGASLQIFFQELLCLYNGGELKKQRISYRGFVLSQQSRIGEKGLDHQKEYWMQVFKKDISVLSLPEDKKRPLYRSYKGATYELTVNKEELQDILILLREEKITIFNFMLSAVNLLLYQYTDELQICVGTPVLGRYDENMKELIGMFVNTIVLKNEIVPEQTFREFLQNVKIGIIKGYKNQEFPFESLVEALGIKGDRSRNPLFDVMLILREEGVYELDDLKIEPYTVASNSAQFDLSFEVTEMADGWKLGINYCTDIFSMETVMKMLSTFIKLIKALPAKLDYRLCDIEIVDPEEKNILIKWGEGQKYAVSEGCHIHDLVEQTVLRIPSKIALMTTKIQLTYESFWKLVIEAESVLIDSGVKENEVVMVQIDSSVERVIACLGVLKAGAICLMVEMGTPLKQLEYIKESSLAAVILQYTYNHYIATKITHREKSEEPRELQNGSSKAAYLIYTSGSTGRPKGVLLSHKGIVNQVYSKIEELSLSEGDIVSQSFSNRFVASLWQFLAPLCCGGTVICHEEEVKKNPYHLLEEAQRMKATIISLVPIQLSYYLSEIKEGKKKLTFSAVRSILLTGEKVEEHLVSRFYKQYKIPLINAYGQCETSDDILYYKIPYQRLGDKIPIGRPTINTQVYILKDKRQFQPIGVAGEIYVSGDGLSMGYINDPLGNESKFCHNPFHPDKPLYRTGDYGKWDRAGNIVYLGRKDRQVKIRGIRIEPEEVEQSLLNLKGVNAAAVVVKNRGEANAYLCAYVLAEEGLSETSIRKQLKEKLSSYIIPSKIIKLDSFPMTSTGKCDLQLLESREEVLHTNSKVPPRDKLELELCNLVGELLNLTEVSVEDDFFEIGGNSLQIVKLATILEERYGKIETFWMMHNSTIGDFVNLVKGNQTATERITNVLKPTSEQFVSKEGVVLNIEQPSLSVFYKNCFYNSLLPIITYFNQNIIRVLVEDKILYRFQLEEGSLCVYQSHKAIDKLLSEMGIRYVADQEVESQHIRIIEALNLGHPVILWVDCYEMSIRRQEYKKKHLPHTVLVYGFNSQKQSFQIIEHINEESGYYRKCEISYQDLILAHHAYEINYNQEKYDSYYEFYQDKSLQKETAMNDYQTLNLYIKRFTSDSKEISEGLCELRKFCEYFSDFIQTYEQNSVDLERLIRIINTAVNGKKIEALRSSLLFKDYQSPAAIAKTISEQWILLRNLLLRQLYKRESKEQDKQSCFCNCLGIMERIIKLELLAFDILTEYSERII